MDVISRVLLKIFLRYGFPERIKSDKGKEFTNKKVQAILDLEREQHYTTIAYDHHANGKVERVIRSVRDTVEKFKRDTHHKHLRENWDQLLPFVQFVMNSRIHRVS